MVQRNVRRISSRQLVRVLDNNPALPAFVPTLPAAELAQLITEVGRHDAGMLVEYSTPEQLRSIVDDEVWKRDIPGRPERFDADEFLEWLQVLLDVGDTFAVERLQAMNEDMVTMAFVTWFSVKDLGNLVFDSDQNPNRGFILPDSADLTELVDSFEITPRREQDWEVLQPLVAALRSVDLEYLTAVLTRCCLPETLLRFRDEETASLDAAGERQTSREAGGFVTPQQAGSFLATARDASVEQLTNATAYDADSQDYFDRALRQTLNDILRGPLNNHNRLTHTDVAEDASEVTPLDNADADDVAELQAAVESLGASTYNGALLMLEHQRGDDTSAELPLRRAMAMLSDQDTAHARRFMAEVGYLANVMLAAGRAGGQWLNQKQAMAVVMATCNLGHELVPAFDLTQAPGLVGLFRLGWQVLQRLPTEAVTQCKRFLATEAQQAGMRAWLANDVLKAMSSDAIRAGLELDEFTGVHESLRMLSLFLEEAAVDRLVRLVDHVPTVLRSDGLRIRQAPGFIESRADLEQVAAFLAGLASHVKTGDSS